MDKEFGNFRVPGEWEPHRAVWLAWPYDPISYPDRVEKVEQTVAKIVYALYLDEQVELLVLDQEMQGRAEKILTDLGVDTEKVNFYVTEYTDIWLRDYGPIFLVNPENEKAYTKWVYDAYGGKFESLKKDDEVFRNLSRLLPNKFQNSEFAMESGAFEMNGKGTLLTTEQCLLKCRNIGKTKEENEKELRQMLNTKKIIWLNQGLVNDHTDGHVDEVARFVSPTKILCAYEDNQQDENYQNLKENFEILENSTDQDNNKFEIVKLPMPHMKYDDGSKAPVSYANFYIGNRSVLAAVFSDPNDAKALEILKECFPDKNIIPIDCTDLIYGGGAIHCITCNEPK